LLFERHVKFDPYVFPRRNNTDGAGNIARRQQNHRGSQPVLRLSAPSGVLRLRAEPTERRRIQWAEDVIDNEGMGKKSSKGKNTFVVFFVAFTDFHDSLLHLPQAPRC
jgi:hypothetical protein